MAQGGIDGVSSWLGLRWESADTVRLEIRPELINAGGLLSGVATYALVDYCMGSTLWKETSDEEAIATVSIAINYVTSANEGEAICRTQLDRRNRHHAVMRSDVFAVGASGGSHPPSDSDGRLLATAVGSYAIYPRRKVDA